MPTDSVDLIITVDRNAVPLQAEETRVMFDMRVAETDALVCCLTAYRAADGDLWVQLEMPYGRVTKRASDWESVRALTQTVFERTRVLGEPA